MKGTILIPALFACLLSSASAASITIMPAATIADAITDRNAWLIGMFGGFATPEPLEDFETFGYGPWTHLATGVGAFDIEAGGLPSYSNGTRNNEFTILNSSDTPFSGRYNTTPGGSNWLDSNDITKLMLTTSLTNLYFFITDVNDIDGTLTLHTADGTTTSGFAPRGADGNIYFVGISSEDPIGFVEWLNSSQNDGFGLDDFGTADPPAIVPEPATWLFVAGGLLVGGAITKWKARARAASKTPTQTPRA